MTTFTQTTNELTDIVAATLREHNHVQTVEVVPPHFHGNNTLKVMTDFGETSMEILEQRTQGRRHSRANGKLTMRVRTDYTDARSFPQKKDGTFSVDKILLFVKATHEEIVARNERREYRVNRGTVVETVRQKLVEEFDLKSYQLRTNQYNKVVFELSIENVSELMRVLTKEQRATILGL